MTVMKQNDVKLAVVSLMIAALACFMSMTRERQLKASQEESRLAPDNLSQWQKPTTTSSFRSARHFFRKNGASGAPSQSPGRISNELVVRLQPGMDLADLARLTGIAPREVESIPSLNAHRLKFSNELEAEQAKALMKANPLLASVEDNYRLGKPVLTQTGDGSAVLEPNRLKLGDANGQLIIGLVDTGVQRTGSGLEEFLLQSISVAEETAVPTGELQHGTAMASAILQGINMIMQDGGTINASILPVDVYGNSETTTTYQVAEGLIAAIEAGATVINLSLGSEAGSQLLQDIIQQASELGVVFLAAAGNTPTSDPTYPAAYQEVIAVTATDRTGDIAAYANYGEFVDVGTPGSVVVDFNGTKQLVTGTSVATALASGITAGLSEIRKSSPAKIESAIREGLALK